MHPSGVGGGPKTDAGRRESKKGTGFMEKKYKTFYFFSMEPKDGYISLCTKAFCALSNGRGMWFYRLEVIDYRKFKQSATSHLP